MSQVTLGTDAGQMLSTTAALSSEDPNIDPQDEKSFEKYEYFCRKFEGEEYPKDSDGKLQTENPSSPIPAIDLPRVPHGCFGSGPGAIDFDEGNLTIQGNWFIPNYTYEVAVRVSKTYEVDGENITKESIIFLKIDVIPGTAPNVEINCKPPTKCPETSDGVRVATNFNSILNCKCVNCNETEPLQYDWIVKKENDLHTIGTINPTEDQITGMNRDSLTITPDLWSADSNVLSYVFECEITRIENGIKAKSMFKVAPNKKPHAGSCSVSPTSGMALKTKFKVSCTDWHDSDDADNIIYDVVQILPDDGGERAIFAGVSPSGITLLDVGIHKIRVTITDPLGGFGVVLLENITVIPIPLNGLSVSIAFKADEDTDEWTEPKTEKNLILADLPVRFNLSYEIGFAENHELFAINVYDPSKIITETFNFTHAYTTTLPPGVWNVTITEHYSRRQLGQSQTVTAIQKAPAVFLNPISAGGSIGENIKFEFTTNTPPSLYDCLVIDAGDGTQDKWGPVPYCNNWPLFADVATYNGEFTSPMIFSHAYGTPGFKTVTATLTNFLSDSVSPVTFKVTNDTCFLPLLEFTNSRQDMNNSVEIFCGNSHTFYVNVKLDCSYTLDVTRTWKIEPINMKSQIAMGRLDLSSLDLTKNQLTIPKRFHCFGLIKVTFTVAMNPEKLPLGMRELEATVSGFFKVVPSEIIAKFLDSTTSLLSLGTEEGQMLKTTAALSSVDPNIGLEDDKIFNKYEYFCRKLKFIPKPELERIEQDKPNSCFASGPQAINFEKGKLDFKGNWFGAGLHELALRISKTYVVDGENVTMESMTYLSVDIIPGTPPVVGINCARPTMCPETSAGIRVSKNVQTTLSCKCENCDKGEKLEYEWVVKTNIFSDVMQSIDPSEDQVTGLNVDTLIFTPKLWGSNVNALEFECSITRMESGINSKSSLRVDPNKVPSDGSCSVYPASGTAMKTTFRVSCIGWKDLDDSDNVIYHMVQLLPDGGDKPLFTGSNPAGEAMLSAGNHTIKVTIIDPLGDSAPVVVLKNIVVETMPLGDVDLTNMFETQTAELNPMTALSMIDSLVTTIDMTQEIINLVPDSAAANTPTMAEMLAASGSGSTSTVMLSSSPDLGPKELIPADEVPPGMSADPFSEQETLTLDNELDGSVPVETGGTVEKSAEALALELENPTAAPMILDSQTLNDDYDYGDGDGEDEVLTGSTTPVVKSLPAGNEVIQKVMGLDPVNLVSLIFQPVELDTEGKPIETNVFSLSPPEPPAPIPGQPLQEASDPITLLPDATKVDSGVATVTQMAAKQLSAQFKLLTTPGLTAVGFPSQTPTQDTVSLKTPIITPEQVVETLKAFNIGPPPEGKVKAILFPQPEVKPEPFQSADPFYIEPEVPPPVLGVIMMGGDAGPMDLKSLTGASPQSQEVFTQSAGGSTGGGGATGGTDTVGGGAAGDRGTTATIEPTKTKVGTTAMGDVEISSDGTASIGGETMSTAAASQVMSLTHDQQKQMAEGKPPKVPSDTIVGSLVMTLPDGGATTVNLKGDTVAMKVVPLKDPVTGETLLSTPVQVSTSGIASLEPEHLFTPDGKSMVHLLPGAPKWASLPGVGESLKELDTVILPMTVQGCDALKLGEHTKVYEGCLTNLKNQLDVMSDAVSKVNSEMLTLMDKLPLTSENAASQLTSLENVISSSITTNVDPATGIVEPQATVNLEGTEAATKMIEKLSEKLQDPEVLSRLIPKQAEAAGKTILQTTAALIDAQKLSKTSPLRSDRKQTYETELRNYEPMIPADPDQMIYTEDLTPEEWGEVAAKHAAKKQAQKAAKQFNKVIDAVSKLAVADQSKLERGDVIDVKMEVPGASMQVSMGKASQAFTKPIGNPASDGYAIKIPKDPCKVLKDSLCDDSHFLKIVIVYFKNNYLELRPASQASTNTGLLDVKIQDIDGKDVLVTDLEEPITLIFKGKMLGPMIHYNGSKESLIATRQVLNVHRVEVSHPKASLIIQVRPLDPDVKLMLFFAKKPVGPLPDQHSAFTYVSKTNDSVGFRRFNWWIPPDVFKGFEGTCYIGVGRIMPDGTKVDNITTVRMGKWIFSRNFCSGYRFRAIIKGCYFMNVFKKDWDDNGVQSLKEASPKYLKCVTNHLTPFAAGLFTPPNTIDFDYVFNNLHFRNNLTIYCSLFFIFIIFFILFMWAAWQDSQDKLKVGSIPLKDNQPGDKYVYEIITFTGNRRGCGTDSNVSFVLSGDRGETTVREMNSNIREKRTLRAGATDSWIMSSRRPLGNLLYLRIWHDNMDIGAFKSWFLSKVVIVDCQTGEKFVFMNNRWLAVDEDDGIIGVAFMANIIVFPIVILIVHLFRKARLHHKRPSHIVTALRKDNQSVPPLTYNTALRYKERGCMLACLTGSISWVWRQIAWLLVIGIVISSTFLVFSYGITFGDEKCRKWVTTMLLSIFASILIMQPLKIVFLALFCTCLWRRYNDFDEEDYEENEESFYVKPDEEYLCGEQADYVPKTHVTTSAYELEKARTERMMEKKSYEIVRELTIYVIFIIIVLIMAYGGRDVTSFQYTDQLRHTFLGYTDHKVYKYAFDEVRTSEQFFHWASYTLLPGARAKWYNGKPAIDMRGFVGDKTSRILGHPLIRQVRSKDQPDCRINHKVRHLFADCNRQQSLFTEDNRDYGPKWELDGADISIRDEYKYRPASDFKGLPIDGLLGTYSGGGYVIPMVLSSNDTINNFQELLVEGWIDNRTRAVIVEFSVYNAFVNIFEPVRLYRYAEPFALVVIVSEVLFCAYVFLFLIKEVSKIDEQGLSYYFSQFWSYLEVATIVCALATTGFYIARLMATNDISNEVFETNGNYFIKIQLAAWTDENFTCFLAAVLFLANVKILQFLRYNERLGILVDTVRESSNQIMAFILVFIIIYMAFCSTFYLLLNMKLRSFSNMLLVFEEAFAAMLGKFSFREFIEASWLAPWIFFVFMIVQAMILINMLITIITHMYLEIKTDMGKRGNDVEVAKILKAKMRNAFGMKIEKSETRQMEDARADMTVHTTLDARSDQLLNKLNDFMGGKLNIKALERHAKKEMIKQRKEDEKLKKVEVEPLEPNKQKSDKNRRVSFNSVVFHLLPPSPQRKRSSLL